LVRALVELTITELDLAAYEGRRVRSALDLRFKQMVYADVARIKIPRDLACLIALEAHLHPVAA
jgi:hypothetical protein